MENKSKQEVLTKEEAMQKRKAKEFDNDKNYIGIYIVVLALLLFFFLRGCQHSECNPVKMDSFNWLTATCSRNDSANTFSDVQESVPVMNNDKDWYGWYQETWFDTKIDKSLNKDGSYTITVTAVLSPLPDWLKWLQLKRKVTFPKVKRDENCIDLVPREDGDGLQCVEPNSNTRQENQETSALQKVEETKISKDLQKWNKALAANKSVMFQEMTENSK